MKPAQGKWNHDVSVYPPHPNCQRGWCLDNGSQYRHSIPVLHKLVQPFIARADFCVKADIVLWFMHCSVTLYCWGPFLHGGSFEIYQFVMQEAELSDTESICSCGTHCLFQFQQKPCPSLQTACMVCILSLSNLLYAAWHTHTYTLHIGHHLHVHHISLLGLITTTSL